MPALQDSREDHRITTLNFMDPDMHRYRDAVMGIDAVDKALASEATIRGFPHPQHSLNTSATFFKESGRSTL
jgi:hypothetical protein